MGRLQPESDIKLQNELNQKAVKDKVIELGYAARAVIQQLANHDGTPEGLEAKRILESALIDAVPDAAGKELLAV